MIFGLRLKFCWLAACPCFVGFGCWFWWFWFLVCIFFRGRSHGLHCPTKHTHKPGNKKKEKQYKRGDRPQQQRSTVCTSRIPASLMTNRRASAQCAVLNVARGGGGEQHLGPVAVANCTLVAWRTSGPTPSQLSVCHKKLCPLQAHNLQAAPKLCLSQHVLPLFCPGFG